MLPITGYRWACPLKTRCSQLLHVRDRVGHVIALRPHAGNALKAQDFFLRIALALLVQKLVDGSANQLTLGRHRPFAGLTQACLLTLRQVNLRSGECLSSFHGVKIIHCECGR